MTTFVLLSFVTAALASAWLTFPLWRDRLHGSAPASTFGTPASTFGAPTSTFGKPASVFGAPASTFGVHASGSNHHALLLPAALALFLLVLAGTGYAWLGSAGDLGVGPEAAAAPPTTATDRRKILAATEREPLFAAEARVSSMVDKLAARVQAEPADADGWHMLARSYAALGKHAQAIAAYRSAARLRPDDATLLAEWAFSAAVIDAHDRDGEPLPLVERALRLDAQNPKALALAGTLALERRDYGSAATYWERLARVEPADSPVGRQLQASIAQVRQLAAAPPALASLDARAVGAVEAITDPTAGVSAAASISGIVTLAPVLRDRADPDDTVFVYARPQSGPRMPLAVLRKHVRDLPLRFTLDDSLALAGGARLSGATTVVVGARIAKGGNAVAQDGDLQGQLLPVQVGSRNLKIEINQVVATR